MYRPSLAISLLCLTHAACSLPSQFECAEVSACNLEQGGQCTTAASGKRWCEYPASLDDCPSGRRWSAQAGDSLAGSCVALAEADAGPNIDASELPDADMTPDAPAEPDAPGEPDAPPPDAPTPDAPPPDAGAPDAPPDAATSGPVMVAAFDKDWKPLVSTAVLAHDTSGAITAETTTNGAGIASLVVPIGGMVTVANRVADLESLTTITGVQPFDVLTTINLDTSRYAGPQIGDLTVGMPGPFSGATEYRVGSSCESSLGPVANPSTNMTGKVYRDCVDSSSYVDVLATARNGDKTVAFSVARAKLLQMSALASMAPWTAARNMDVQVKNVPVAAQDATFTADIVYRGAVVSLFPETVSTNLYRVTVPVSPPSGGSLRAQMAFEYPQDGDQFPAAVVRQTIPADALTPIFDAAAAPPKLHTLVLSDADMGRPRLSWQMDAPLTGIVGGYVLMSWESPGSGKPAVAWALVIPSGSGARAPVLPSALDALIPRKEPAMQIVLGDAGARATTYTAFRTWFIPYLDPKSELFERVTTTGNAFQ